MRSTQTGHRWAAMIVAAILMTLAATAAPSQTFTTLHSFDSTDGANPFAALAQATDGDLYAVTHGGGANMSCSVVGFSGCGTVFKINPSGPLTTLYDFCPQSGCPDGGNPLAGLIQANDGNLYGTTPAGGANNNVCPEGCGTVFKISPAGALTTLYSFCTSPQNGVCPDGSSPDAPLVQATNGNFYGTTYYGGANGTCNAGAGCGTVFKITPSGTLTTLHSFDSTDGENPQAALIQATDGNLYGATFYGGATGSNAGTIFKITPSGTLTTLYSFCLKSSCKDGTDPAALIQATDGNFYGTTYGGGARGHGTVFKVTPSGRLTTLYSFCLQSGCTDGKYPEAGLVQATDGSFYGTTYEGGTKGDGTVFKITSGGTLTTLYSFCSRSGCKDGEGPYAGLVQATNGTFYGTTVYGGANGTCSSGCGTVFSLSVGLGPFVETQPTSGKLGAAVKILGTNLTGATGVTFSGAAAVFHVLSSSEITTTVPTGATTGPVEVVTPSGTLTSNVNFRVE
jgi:uncharacterized repeat protein (TIGR03803 family)